MNIGNVQQKDNTNVSRNTDDDSKRTRRNHNHIKEKQEKRGSIYAGDLNMFGQDEIGSKQAKAQKKAMKTILDQFKADQKVDEKFIDHQKNQEKLYKDAKVYDSEINTIHGMKDKLKESYGIDEDSVEQKNLELVEKSMKNPENITDEELDQLTKMGSLTEYQKEALKYDTMESVWQTRKENALTGIANEGKTIEAMKVEIVKSHPMVDSLKEAADIIERVSKEIIGSLINESKDHIDEEIEKKKEEAKVQEEKREEKEAQQQKAAADNSNASVDGDQASNRVDTMIKQEQASNNIEQIQESDQNLKELQYQIKTVAKNKKVLPEDLLGIAIDEQI